MKKIRTKCLKAKNFNEKQRSWYLILERDAQIDHNTLGPMINQLGEKLRDVDIESLRIGYWGERNADTIREDNNKGDIEMEFMIYVNGTVTKAQSDSVKLNLDNYRIHIRLRRDQGCRTRYDRNPNRNSNPRHVIEDSCGAHSYLVSCKGANHIISLMENGETPIFYNDALYQYLESAWLATKVDGPLADSTYTTETSLVKVLKNNSKSTKKELNFSF